MAAMKFPLPAACLLAAALQPALAQPAPPAEAVAACSGRALGAAVTFTGPRGEAVTGTCVRIGDQIAARPDRPPPNDAGGPPPGSGRPPPQEAVAACAGKVAGAAVTFTGPRGDTIAATCRERNGLMAAAPNDPPPQ